MQKLFSASELEEELQLTQMMTKDLKKLWSSYAKKALAAKTEREKKQEKRGFLSCDTREDLVYLWGYGEIDEETYLRGLDYFDAPVVVELSAVEKHRSNIKELMHRYEGTAIEINNELHPVNKDTRDIFEKMKAEEVKHRYESVY